MLANLGLRPFIRRNASWDALRRIGRTKLFHLITKFPVTWYSRCLVSANSFLSRADTAASAAIQGSGFVLRRSSLALVAHYRPILLSLVVLLIVLKAPMLLVRPRLWAEESF